MFIKPSACWTALKLPRVSGSASGSNARSLTNIDYFSDNSGPADPAQAVDGLVMRGVIKWPSIKGDFHNSTGKPMTPPACTEEYAKSKAALIRENRLSGYR